MQYGERMIEMMKPEILETVSSERLAEAYVLLDEAFESQVFASVAGSRFLDAVEAESEDGACRPRAIDMALLQVSSNLYEETLARVEACFSSHDAMQSAKSALRRVVNETLEYDAGDSLGGNLAGAIDRWKVLSATRKGAPAPEGDPLRGRMVTASSRHGILAIPLWQLRDILVAMSMESAVKRLTETLCVCTGLSDDGLLDAHERIDPSIAAAAMYALDASSRRYGSALGLSSAAAIEVCRVHRVERGDASLAVARNLLVCLASMDLSDALAGREDEERSEGQARAAMRTFSCVLGACLGPRAQEAIDAARELLSTERSFMLDGGAMAF